MQQLIMLKGLPCTGKTEWAKNWVAQSPRTRVVISRDNIRTMLGVPIFTDKRERLVSSIESEGVRKAIKAGYDVVIDAYNLNPKVEKKWEKLVHNYVKDGRKIQLQVIPFTRPIKDCIISDSKRPGDKSVGAKLIWNLYEKFLKPQVQEARVKSIGVTVGQYPLKPSETYQFTEPVEEDMTW